MRHKLLLGGLLSAVFLFFVWNTIHGVETTITNYPIEIGEGDFEVTVQIVGADAGTNYLRVDLFREGTNNYFGETFNGSDWYQGSDGKSYYSIQITTESSASATLKAKVGSPSLTNYPTIGEYLMRVRRYTTSGSSATDTQQPVKVSINAPVAVITPEPEENKSDEVINTPSPTPKVTSTPMATKRPTPKPTFTPVANEERVLAMEDEISDENANDEDVLKEDEKKTRGKLPAASIFLLIIGGGMVAYGGFYVLRELKNKYNQKKENEEK